MEGRLSAEHGQGWAGRGCGWCIPGWGLRGWRWARQGLGAGRSGLVGQNVSGIISMVTPPSPPPPGSYRPAPTVRGGDGKATQLHPCPPCSHSAGWRWEIDSATPMRIIHLTITGTICQAPRSRHLQWSHLILAVFPPGRHRCPHCTEEGSGKRKHHSQLLLPPPGSTSYAPGTV